MKNLGNFDWNLLFDDIQKVVVLAAVFALALSDGCYNRFHSESHAQRKFGGPRTQPRTQRYTTIGCRTQPRAQGYTAIGFRAQPRAQGYATFGFRAQPFRNRYANLRFLAQSVWQRFEAVRFLTQPWTYTGSSLGDSHTKPAIGNKSEGVTKLNRGWIKLNFIQQVHRAMVFRRGCHEKHLWGVPNYWLWSLFTSIEARGALKLF